MFTTVLVTVLLNATTARLVAKWLKVYLNVSKGILIVGASEASRVIAKYLQTNNRHVVLIDSNIDNIEKAKLSGLDAMEANVYSEDISNDVEFSDIGYLFAFTGSFEVNKFANNKFKNQLGENGAFRLISSDELRNEALIPEQSIFSKKDDYINFSEVARDYPLINELSINSKEHYLELINELNNELKKIPLFVKDLEGELHIICGLSTDFKIEKDFKLVYLGKPFD